MDQPNEIRVLRIINRFNLGGPTFNVAYLTRHLTAPFHTKLVGGMKDESEASSEFILDQLGIQPEIVSEMRRSISPVADFKAYREIASIIRSYKPHIVHTHASKAGTLGRLAAIHHRVPIVLHTFHGHVFHSYFGSLKTNLYKGIERYLAHRSTRIIAISQIQRNELGEIHRIAPLDKIEVVPLGFDLARFQTDQVRKRSIFRERYGLQENEVAIGIIGRLVPVKNHGMFIRAIRRVSAAQPTTRFFIIGDGESNEALKSICRSEGVAFTDQQTPSADQPLCFTSWIREVDLVMAGLDIVTLTSLNEGTPVSLIEAQSAAKPVVSTRVGGIQDIVVENGSALLCDVDDNESFAAHLVTLAKDPEKRHAMGLIGREHVINRFGFHRLVSDMETLYLKLCREKSVWNR